MRKPSLSIVVLLFIYLFATAFTQYETNGLAVSALCLLVGVFYWTDCRFPPREKRSPEIVALEQELAKQRLQLTITQTQIESNRKSAQVVSEATSIKTTPRF